MVKRRRLLTPMKSKGKVNSDKEENNAKDKGVATARGRFKGALMDVLGHVHASQDTSDEETRVKHDGNANYDKDYNSDEDERSHRKKSPARQSYVLKLFDRSVDLSQFSEDSPLYPICRAWILNQPKAIYKKYGRIDEKDQRVKGLELPRSEGPSISKIPELLPEQKEWNKNKINLNYREAPPPNKEELIEFHAGRWANVRRAWLAQATLAETRYAATQRVLDEMINANVL